MAWDSTEPKKKNCRNNFWIHFWWLFYIYHARNKSARYYKLSFIPHIRFGLFYHVWRWMRDEYAVLCSSTNEYCITKYPATVIKRTDNQANANPAEREYQNKAEQKKYFAETAANRYARHIWVMKWKFIFSYGWYGERRAHNVDTVIPVSISFAFIFYLIPYIYFFFVCCWFDQMLCDRIKQNLRRIFFCLTVHSTRAQRDGVGWERAYTTIEAKMKSILSRTFDAHFNTNANNNNNYNKHSVRFVEMANNKAIRRLNEMLVKHIVSIILERAGEKRRKFYINWRMRSE